MQTVQVSSGNSAGDLIPNYYELLGLNRGAQTADLLEEVDRLASSYAELASFGGAKADEARVNYKLCSAALDVFESDEARAAFDAQLDAQNRPQEERPASDERPVDWFEETLRHYRSGDLGAARIASDHMRQQYRDDPEAFALSAEILLASGDKNDAKQALHFVNEAVVLDTDGAAACSVHRARSRVFLKLGQQDKALDEIDVAYRAASNDQKPFLCLLRASYIGNIDGPGNLFKSCLECLKGLCDLSVVEQDVDADWFERSRASLESMFVGMGNRYVLSPSLTESELTQLLGDAPQVLADFKLLLSGHVDATGVKLSWLAASQLLDALEQRRSEIPASSYAHLHDSYQTYVGNIDRALQVSDHGYIQEMEKLDRERVQINEQIKTLAHEREATVASLLRYMKRGNRTHLTETNSYGFKHFKGTVGYVPFPGSRCLLAVIVLAWQTFFRGALGTFGILLAIGFSVFAAWGIYNYFGEKEDIRRYDDETKRADALMYRKRNTDNKLYAVKQNRSRELADARVAIPKQ